MMGVRAILFSWLLWWRPLGYILVFAGMLLEGDAVLFTVAFLTRQGFFDIGDMAITVLVGVLVGDMGWYQLGIWVQHSESFAFIRRWLERVTGRFDRHLMENPLRTLFLSKFAYGLHHPILIRAGAIGISARRFLRSDVLASLAWVMIVGGLGYASSASSLILRHRLRFIERTFLVSLIAFFLFEWIIGHNSKKRL